MKNEHGMVLLGETENVSQCCHVRH